MTKFVAADSVVEALTALTSLAVKRSGRTAAVGYLLLKAKEVAPQQPIDVSSTGAGSVASELNRFLRVAPGTPLPDVNPFGLHDGRVEYLAENYERRGTYTHLYPGRNLASFLQVEQTDQGFRVIIPEGAAAEVAAKLGSKLPLEPCAAFFMRNEQLPDDATATTVVDRFLATFHISDVERDALFEAMPSFEIDLDAQPFPNSLSALPPTLQPPAPTATHATTAQASVELVPLTTESRVQLVIDDAVRRRARRAVGNSRAIALVGPPGSAKSLLWDELLEEAAVTPSSLGLSRPPKFMRVTAEVDWTARTIIGGHYPDENGRLVFREGYLLQAIKNDQLLWIDELNRADLDRVLGPVFTFLAGQSVDLGPTEQSPDARQMILAWSDTVESGCKESGTQRLYHAGTDWRLIGTYNNVDRGRVFPMGSALTRRWAIVPVQPIAVGEARVVLESICRPPVADILARAYEVHLRYLAIGLAPFVDIARFVAASSDDTSSTTATLAEQEAVNDGYVLYMGQQLARLDPERRDEFYQELSAVVGPNLTDELQRL